YARSDADRGWDSLVRNTLFAHAEAFPELWYGIWTGPDSFYGPEADRPGEADAHLATALTDYPALNAHLHTSPLRALQGVLGVRGTADGLRIDPHVPTETFDVRWPRLHLWSRPDGIGGAWTPVGGGAAVLRVTLPSGLRGGPVSAWVDGAQAPVVVEDDVAVLEVSLRPGEPLVFELGR
ncbi:MAG: hypothetical protein KC621_21300, partial [Myxococcales bacterium]|nr:hypothetical protein [Myxococcales bacterium]